MSSEANLAPNSRFSARFGPVAKKIINIKRLLLNDGRERARCKSIR